MKKNNQSIDDFFRDVLSDHTIPPSAPAREATLKEAAAVITHKKSGKRWFLLLLSGVVIVMSGLGTYFALNRSHETQIQTPSMRTSQVAKDAAPSAKAAIENAELPINNQVIKTNHSATLAKPAVRSVPSINNQPHKKSSIQQTNSVANHNEPSLPAVAAVVPEETKAVIQATREPEKPAEKAEAPLLPAESASVPAELPDTLTRMKNPVRDTSGEIVVSSQDKKSRQENPERDWNISTGVYYSPEWMFNILEGEKFVNSFGVEGTFHYQKYSIRTGVGLSITRGTNEIAISYQDYVGSFDKLDSMSFKWNEQHNKLVPTYFLSNKNVYNSLMKLENARIVKRYTYLQVPLILGYDFLKNDNFSIGLRAGPILSILLESKQVSGEYDPGKNKVIAINQIAPERIQTNWQLMGGVNACLNFSRRFGIELEPEVRYYFNSVYEKSDNTKKPWSAGFRVAFHFIY